MADISVYVIGTKNSGKKTLITSLLQSQDNSFEHDDLTQDITLEYDLESSFVFKYYNKPSRIARFQYPKSDIILITLDPTSLESIQQFEEWLAEAKTYMSHETTKYILVVTKSELKDRWKITESDIPQMTTELEPEIPIMNSAEPDELLLTMLEMSIFSPPPQITSIDAIKQQNDKIMPILQERYNNLFQKVKPNATQLEQPLSLCLTNNTSTKLSRLRAMKLIIEEATKQYHQSTSIDINQIISTASESLVDDNDKAAFNLSTSKKSSGFFSKESKFERMAKKIRKIK